MNMLFKKDTFNISFLTRAIVIFIPITICILAIFGQYLIATIALVILCTLYLPKNLSLLTRLVSAYGLFFVANIVAILVTSALKIEYSLLVLLPLYSFAVGYFAWHQKRNILTEKPVLFASDIAIITLSVVVFVMLFASFRTSTSQQLNILSVGEDNASHYALANSIATNRSYAYFISPEKSGVLPALKNYPQGLHVNLAINSQILANNHVVAQPFLIKSYSLQICAYLGLLFMLLLLSIRAIGLPFVNEKTFIKTVAISAPILIYAVGFGTNTYLFSYGFHSQIVAYIFLILSFIWLSSNETNMWTKCLAAALCGVAVAFAWFFLVPVFLVFILIWATINWRLIVPRLLDLRYILLILITGLLVAIPLIIQHNGGDGTSVNTPGGVYALPYIVLLGYGCLALLYILSRRLRQLFDGSPTSLLFLLLIINLLFSVVIGTYQLATAHVFAYYFYKSLYILPPLCAALGFGFIFIVVNITIKEKVFGKTGSIVSMIILAASFYFSFVQHPIDLAKMTSRIDSALVTYAMNKTEKIQTPQGEYDIVLTRGCAPVEAYMTQRWLSAVLLTDGLANKTTIYYRLLDGTSPVAAINDYKIMVKNLELVHEDVCTPSVDVVIPNDLKSTPQSSLGI